MYAIYVYRPEATANGNGLKMHRLAPFDGIELFSFAATQDEADAIIASADELHDTHGWKWMVDPLTDMMLESLSAAQEKAAR